MLFWIYSENASLKWSLSAINKHLVVVSHLVHVGHRLVCVLADVDLYMRSSVCEILWVWDLFVCEIMCVWDLLCVKSCLYEIFCVWNLVCTRRSVCEILCFGEHLCVKSCAYEKICVWNVVCTRTSVWKSCVYKKICVWNLVCTRRSVCEILWVKDHLSVKTSKCLNFTLWQYWFLYWWDTNVTCIATWQFVVSLGNVREVQRSFSFQLHSFP